jgi:hypothetical protein
VAVVKQAKAAMNEKECKEYLSKIATRVAKLVLRHDLLARFRSQLSNFVAHPNAEYLWQYLSPEGLADAWGLIPPEEAPEEAKILCDYALLAIVHDKQAGPTDHLISKDRFAGCTTEVENLWREWCNWSVAVEYHAGQTNRDRLDKALARVEADLLFRSIGRKSILWLVILLGFESMMVCCAQWCGIGVNPWQKIASSGWWLSAASAVWIAAYPFFLGKKQLLEFKSWFQRSDDL